MNALSTRGAPRAAAAALAALALAALVVVPSAPARADSNVTLTFEPGEVTVPFGGDWLVEVQLNVAVSDDEGDGYPVPDPTWGTVDIQLDDVAGIYSAGLAIQRGGVVYFARPTAAPLLAAGVHHATAIFRPSQGGLLESQSATPLTITVTPLGLSPRLEILEVPGDEASPYAVLDLTGEYVDALGTPAGSWSVTVERDGTQLQQSAVDVQAGDGPVNLSLAEYVKPGTVLTVAAAFTPEQAVAGGVTLAETAPQEIVTPALTPIEWLSRAVAVPWWMVAVAVAVLLGAVAVAIVVLVRYRRKPAEPVETPDDDDASGSADAHEVAEGPES